MAHEYGIGPFAPNARLPRAAKRHADLIADLNGGEGGIRTHGGLPPTAVFKTAALNHSATSPREQRFAQGRRFVQVVRRWDFTFAARCGTVCRCVDGVC